MTLVLSVIGKKNLWVLTDRRLTAGKRVVRDDARKAMQLIATDAHGVLAYSGFGETTAGTQPSDWMANVLRGRNWPFVQCLHAIANAMADQFPRHLSHRVGNQGLHHQILVPTYIPGQRPVLHEVSALITPGSKHPLTRVVTIRRDGPPGTSIAPNILVSGSGLNTFDGQFRADPANNGWTFVPGPHTMARFKVLQRLVKAVDRELIHHRHVCDYLASFNLEVSKLESTVGPNCTVSWIGRPGVNSYDYEGDVFHDITHLPSVALGISSEQTKAVFSNLLKEHGNHFGTADLTTEKEREDASQLWLDKIREGFAKHPHHPDERLR